MSGVPLRAAPTCRQFLHRRADQPVGGGEVELRLEVQPELGIDAEPVAEPNVLSASIVSVHVRDAGVLTQSPPHAASS